ncbi:protein-L-isoaspartate O-methyltransferase [Skermanella stibiiresistens SB22]|uniref:Protein-L-isoaspartate O-methyltransferase n=1 Tax=Skermanella stibiiresistens SB22 TaxID=1385369 RepID=W9HEC8_9PROT|nr:protein-L-isoaspartate O-methyltransferase [Skermanella stibiiresistens]EWY42238.1 protein-L-isoaspartate O-methyltransferase [Skermanella stibiiresistens SB22]
MPDYSAARHNMVEGQVRPNKVTDHALVEAMSNIPRELFVPKASRGFAYVDEDIPVAKGRYLIEPMVIARLLQEARVKPNDIVLDLGCGTGYASAILSRMAATVVALEEDAELSARADGTLRELGVDNVVLVQGPLIEGHAKQAPYDVILIHGAVAEVPAAILEQLAEGGRLVTVVSPDGRMGQARIFQRTGKVETGRILFDAATPLLPGFEPKPVFQF